MVDYAAIEAIHKRLDGHDDAITNLNDWRTELTVERAKESVDRKHFDEKFAELKASFNELNDSIKKGVYAILGFFLLSLGGAVMAFIINGGLHVQ